MISCGGENSATKVDSYAAGGQSIGSSEIPFQICDALSTGGFTDWAVLPAFLKRRTLARRWNVEGPDVERCQECCVSRTIPMSSTAEFS